MEINKWCEPHWTMLREAIDARGMMHLVAKSGAAAAAMTADELRFGTARDAEGFDPLLRAYWMISARVLRSGGEIFTCPCCQIQRHGETCTDPRCQQFRSAQEMIGNCADFLRGYVEAKGLLVAGGDT